MQKVEEPVLLFSIGVMAVLAVIALIVGTTSIIAALRRHPAQLEQIAPKQLHFAAVVLTGLGLIFLLSMAMYFWGVTDGQSVDRGREIFDACKTIIPPIVTLILGYYFGKSTERTESRPQALPTPEEPREPVVPARGGRGSTMADG